MCVFSKFSCCNTLIGKCFNSHLQSYPANKTENLEALVARVETAKEQLREEMEAILKKSGKSDENKMVPEIPSVTMEQIGGLEIAKKELIEQIMVNTVKPALSGHS